MFVEVEYGDLDVSHVDNVIIVYIGVWNPLRVAWFAIELSYQIVDVSHVRLTITDTYYWT